MKKISLSKALARVSGVTLSLVAVMFVFVMKGAIGDAKAPAELLKK
ncbi:hypothetical protein [Paenibacillus sp. A3]|nr:hypothetical protein [Paenibacillus sp. A3]